MLSFHFQEFLTKARIKDDPIQKASNYYKPANETHSFHSEIPFGTFALPFKKSVFPRENSLSGR